VYGITIINDAPNKEAAMKFVDFLLSNKGMAIIEKNGQQSLVPSATSTYKNIPNELKKYARE